MEWYEYLSIFLNCMNFVMLIGNIVNQEKKDTRLTTEQQINQIHEHVHKFDIHQVDEVINITRKLWIDRLRRKPSLSVTDENTE